MALFSFGKKTKNFISEEGWFEAEIPKKWEQYDDEAGTYAFFDNDIWKGNFRITPLKLNKAITYIDLIKIFKEKENLIEKTIGNYPCLHFKTQAQKDNNVEIVYWWAFHSQDIVFTCSFTTDDKHLQFLNEELIKIENVIKSIKTFH
jgi:hypothetical protein